MRDLAYLKLLSPLPFFRVPSLPGEPRQIPVRIVNQVGQLNLFIFRHSQGIKKDELKHVLKEKAIKFYESKEAEFPDAEQIREIERVIAKTGGTK